MLLRLKRRVISVSNSNRINSIEALLPAYLSERFNSLYKTQEHYQPGAEETEGELPVQTPHLIQTPGYGQHSVAAIKKPNDGIT